MIGYKYFKFNDVKKIGITLRSNEKTTSGEISIKLADGEPIGKFSVDGVFDWTTFTANVCVDNGEYPLYFVYEGEGELEARSISFE